MRITMDVKNAFDGDAKIVRSIGGLTTLKIGPETFTPLNAKLRVDKGNNTAAVAVLSGFDWANTQPSDTIVIEGLVNGAGKAMLEDLMNSQESTQFDVTLGIKVARPDDEKNKWYAQLTGDGVKGVTDKNVGNKGIEVHDEPYGGAHGGTETYYVFRIFVAPDVKTKSTFQYAAKSDGPKPYSWGQK